MSQDIRGSLLWDDESALEDEDTSWDDDEEFDVTDEDCEVMESVGWEPDDLPSDREGPLPAVPDQETITDCKHAFSIHSQDPSVCPILTAPTN
jgi:hypothetical protein